MAIPVHAQYKLNFNDEYDLIFILKDGSIYGVNNEGVIQPFDRTYAGQLIKNEKRLTYQLYHFLMYDAKQDAYEEDYESAKAKRELANHDVLIACRRLCKLWRVFKDHGKKRVVKPDSRVQKVAENNLGTTD